MNPGAKKHATAIALGILTAAISGGLWIQYVEAKNKLNLDQILLALNSKLGEARAQLELALYSRLYLQRNLVAHVRKQPGITQEEFEPLAAAITSQTTGIRNIALARDNVISHVHPLDGNASVIGLELENHPEQGKAVMRMMENRSTVLTGPVELVQGGRAFISRDPIYLAPSDDISGSTYWGFASVVIDLNTILREAGFQKFSGYRIALLEEQDGHDRVLVGDRDFLDSDALKSEHARMKLVMPAAEWSLAAIPEGGWSVERLGKDYLILGLAISVLLGLIVWRMIRHPQLLAEEVEKRRLQIEKEQKLVRELQSALSDVKRLSGLLPICGKCKNVRDDQGYWKQIEDYIKENSEAVCAQGFCPECLKQLARDRMRK